MACTEPILRTEGLTRRFGRRVAVEDLNLRIEEGDIYGFLGLNGAGKTTTLRMLLHLIRPTSGKVFAFGREVRRHFKETMRRIGSLVELPAFYPGLSALRNLEILARLSGERPAPSHLEGLLERLGLGQRMRDKTRTYSQGMRQRLGIAMALVSRPNLVLLDEPTNGLDPGGIQEVRKLVLELNRREGTTFLISSHQLHEVELTCRRVGILRQGRLVTQETTARLVQQATRRVRVVARPAEKALEWLREHPGIETAEAVEDGAVLASLKNAQHAEINAGLVSAGIEVEEFTPLRMSLEVYVLSA